MALSGPIAYGPPQPFERRYLAESAGGSKVRKAGNTMASFARTVDEFPGLPRNEALSSGVSWGAVFAGAFAAGALSLILMALGAGMGLSSLSPSPNAGASASRVGHVAIIWLIFVQIVAAAVGGYLGDRLRTKWVSVHTHEVYFRDTAHGFLVWAVSLVQLPRWHSPPIPLRLPGL